MHACIAKHRIKIVSWFLKRDAIDFFYIEDHHIHGHKSCIWFHFYPAIMESTTQSSLFITHWRSAAYQKRNKFTTKKERELLKPSSQNKAKNVQLKFDFDPVLSELNQQRWESNYLRLHLLYFLQDYHQTKKDTCSPLLVLVSLKS